MENQRTADKNTRKAQTLRLQAVICEVLDCTDEQYSVIVYDEGLRYLRFYLPEDPDGQRTVSGSRVFWNWWKNHWNSRDEQFHALLERYPVHDTEIRRQLYMQYHDGKQLAENLHPHSVVMEESYTSMISELLREECH